MTLTKKRTMNGLIKTSTRDLSNQSIILDYLNVSVYPSLRGGKRDSKFAGLLSSVNQKKQLHK